MNPHVSFSAAEIAFPVVMTVLLGVQLWRRRHFRHDLLGKIGLTAIILAMAGDLPLNFHPAAIRAPAVFDTPFGAVGATGGNA